MKNFIAVIVLFFGSISFAQDKYVLPKMELVGVSAPVGLGELVELSVAKTDNPSNLVSTSVLWKIYDFDGAKLKEAKVRELKDSVIFASGVRSKQMFVIAVATHLYLNREADKVLDVGTKTQILTGYLQIGDKEPDKPPTPPKPPTLPDGRFKLSSFVYGEAVKVQNDLARKCSVDIATAYRGVAAAIRAGAVKTTEEALKNAKDGANTALANKNVDVKLWDSFGVALQDKLYELYTDKKIKVMPDLADALEEIAIGLEAVK